LINTGNKIRGLTLIELITVVAITSIVAGISWQYFKDTHRRSYRSDAIIALTKARAFMEKCYSNYRNYAKTPECDLPAGLQTSPKDLYNITITSTADSYTLKATTKNAQLEDTDCTIIAITQTGDTSNAIAGSTNDKCWPR